MAGDDEKSQWKGLGKYFNSTTVNGRANVAKGIESSCKPVCIVLMSFPLGKMDYLFIFILFYFNSDLCICCNHCIWSLVVET